MSTQTSAALATAQRFTDFSAPASVQYDEQVSKETGKDYWRVTEAFKFYMDDPTEEKWVLIPAGYLTDGATVPRIFWELLPPWGAYGQAAIVHDWLCEHLTVEIKGVVTPITRAQADKAFKQGMIALDVPSWKRNIMYIAVRVYAKLKGISGPTINPLKEKYASQWEVTVPAPLPSAPSGGSIGVTPPKAAN